MRYERLLIKYIDYMVRWAIRYCESIAAASSSMAPVATRLIFSPTWATFGTWHISSYICKYHPLRSFQRTENVI